MKLMIQNDVTKATLSVTGRDSVADLNCIISESDAVRSTRHARVLRVVFATCLCKTRENEVCLTLSAHVR